MSGPTPASTEDLAARYAQYQRMGNPVRDLHPAVIVLVLASIVTFAAIMPGFISAAAACVLYLLIGAVAGVGRHFAILFGRLALFVGGLMFITRAFLIPGSDPWFQFGAVALSSASIEGGLDFALLVLAFSGAVILLFALVPVKRLLSSMGRNGADHRVAFVVLSAFQAITEVGVSTRTVLDAQRSRGVETEGSALRRIRAFLPVLGPVFLTALSATEERALALDARAFNARGPHTKLVVVRPIRPLELIAALFVVTAIVAGTVLYTIGVAR